MKLIPFALTLCLALGCYGQSIHLTPVDADPVARVEAKVTAHVTSYFKTHTPPGRNRSSGAMKVTVDITETKPVDGWTDRFVTAGRATIEPVWQGPAYSQDFEVTAEIDSHNIVRIIETKMVGPSE